MDNGEELHVSCVVTFSPGLHRFFLIRENLSRYKLDSQSSLMLALPVHRLSSQNEAHGNPDKFLRIISGWHKAILKGRRFDLPVIGCLLTELRRERENEVCLKLEAETPWISLFTESISSWLTIFLPTPILLIILGGQKIHMTKSLGSLTYSPPTTFCSIPPLSPTPVFIP